MTAEVKTYPDNNDLVDYINGLYGAGSTTVIVTILKASVYLIQHD